MDSGLRVHGQSLQPVLVTFPLGLFVCATLFDLGNLLGAPGLVGQVGYWTAVAGLVAAALTALAGMIELWDPHPVAARRTTLLGNLPNVASAALFVLVCLARAGAGERHPPSGALLVLEVLALAIGATSVVLVGQRIQLAERDLRRAEDLGFESFAEGPAGFAAEV